MTTATLELSRSRFQFVPNRNSSPPGANRLRAHGLPAGDVSLRLPPQPSAPIRMATRRKDLLAAFSLVYSAYLRTGLVRTNPLQMRITPYQILPTTDVFVASADQTEEVVCTMSLVGDGRLGLPMEAVFPDEVEQRRRSGAELGEVTSLADIHGQDAGRSPLLKVMGFMAQRARRRGIDELLITVHPHHVKFYERFIGFEQIGESRSYGSVLGMPAVPLTLDLAHLHINHPRAYERFFGQAFPAEALCDQPIARSVKAELRRILAACSPPATPEEELAKVA
jgi:hypothetical protein